MATNTKTWITDKDGNRCSVEKWGSEEKARAALATLNQCYYCSDCSDCSGCSGCSRCLDCLDCLDCSDCSGCSRCLDCSDCSRSTQNYKVPSIPDIHKTIYAAVSQKGALDMSDWHSCQTTHCRAGWVVTLAGEAGKALERFHNTALAAQLIYRESGYQINPARFYDSNEDAMADMKRLAGEGN